MLRGDARFRLRDDDVAWREFSGEGILLDLRTSTYFSTNASATVLWRLLAAGTTREALVTALIEHFELDDERARADVETFLAACRQRSFITAADEAS